MSFADLFAGEAEPEHEPEPVEHERPDWIGPPVGELGAVVSLGLVIARSEQGGIAISHALVYSTGVLFELVAHVGGLQPGERHRVFHEQHTGGHGEPADGFLRFGLELPDGQRVSNLVNWRRSFGSDEGPKGPVLVPGGGSGGQSGATTMSWQHSFWLWPLPGPGSLTVYCEWPIARIETSRCALDVAPLLDAVAKVTRLWNEKAAAGAWTHAVGSHTFVTAMQTDTSTEPPGDEVAMQTSELDAIERSLSDALAAVRRSRH